MLVGCFDQRCDENLLLIQRIECSRLHVQPLQRVDVLFFNMDAVGDGIISLNNVKLRLIRENIPLIEEPEITFVDCQDR